MQELAARTREAVAQTQSIVDGVCRACENSCCHQGTMMGSHDVLRLLKGMLLEEGRERTVREGLALRAEELRADLTTLTNIRRLLAINAPEDDPNLQALDTALADWEAFCLLLESGWAVEVDELRGMLRFAGVWAMALRALGSFPGGHAALSTLAQAGSSFRFRGRRIAPPRCLFHGLEGGCLAARWKPGKCANFFCAGTPNVLQELRRGLSFEDFVLGNAAVLSEAEALEAVRLEWSLGREFVEPKVFLGMPPETRAALRELVEGQPGRLVEPFPPGERFLQSTLETQSVLDRLDAGDICWVESRAIDGFALYELAVALDRLRAAGEPVALLVIADELVPLASMAHPLWADAEMSQPLGCLDLYVVE